MQPVYSQDGRRLKYAIVALLLINTTLVGGGLAWAGTEMIRAKAGAPQAAAQAAAHDGSAPTPAPLAQVPVFNQAGFSALVAKVKPSVVNIATSEIVQPAKMQGVPEVPPDWPFGDAFRDFLEHQGARHQYALGSGFIVDSAGYIVTNNHVVDGAREITVTLDDGSSHPAKIVGRDSKTDLALLKIDAGKALPYVSFGDSDKEHVGDWVVAVGNPFGLGGTVTAGIISAHGRNINNGPYDNFLQIDAPINQGNSGGPLFNQSGQVIGIDTAIYSPNGGSVGIGFAIPSNMAAKVVAQLRENGKVERGWLGVRMQAITPALAKAIGLSKKEGVLMDEVLADSPAAAAKIKQGDVITAFDGIAINLPRDLALAVANAHAGERIKLTVWRDGHERAVDVTIAAQKEEKAKARAEDSQEAPVGMALSPLSNEGRAELGLGPTARGVVVTDVTAGSRADKSGVQPGDVIVRIGNEPVTTPAEAAANIHKAESEKKEAVPMLVTRNGMTYYLALQLAQG